MFRNILVAHDGSENAQRAFMQALDLAATYGAKLSMVCVEEPLPHYAATIGEVLEAKTEEDSYFVALAKRATAEAAACNVELHVYIQAGHEVETIVDLAQSKGFDLIVLGFMGHSRALGRVMGGTATNITRLSPCSVLLVK